MTIEGKIVNIEGVKLGRIEIDKTGIITKITEPMGQADFVFKEELIFPGFIDVHVHAREDVSHSQDYKEDFATASAAAINGGVVAIAEMPNNPVPPIDDESYAEKRALFCSAPIHRPSEQPINGHATRPEIVLYAGIGANTRPLAIKVPYKVFMGPSVGDLFFKSFDQLELAIEKYRGQSVSFHCEDPEVLEKNKNQPTHELRRPKEAEIVAINFALKMIEKYKLQGKICHVSTKEGLANIISAKKRGVDVVCEVAPHHLYFDLETINKDLNSDTATYRSDMLRWLQVNPPIRGREDRLALLNGLKNGDVDFLATDHAPHTKEEKLKGLPDGRQATSGMPHLDTYGLFVCWLMKEQQFTPEDIARVCSFNPGKFLSQFLNNQYGKIAEGYVGSLTIIDLGQSTTVKAENLKTKCGWSPFEGVAFPGKVVNTIIKGKGLKG